MLEAGCGTGNYSLGFLQSGIGKLTMMDASEGMLQRAREKVGNYGNAVREVICHQLPTIPYPDESFDVVALIQVLHHLDTYHLNADIHQLNGPASEPNGDEDLLNGNCAQMNGDCAQMNGDCAQMNGDCTQMNGDCAQMNGDCTQMNGDCTQMNADGAAMNVDYVQANGDVSETTYSQKYPNLANTIKEAFRVLKPHGVLLIDHSFSANIDASWVSLAPKALALWKKAFIGGGDLLEVLTAEHFKNSFCITRPGCSVSTSNIFENPELLFDEKWRNCCSEWSFVDRTGELPALLKFVAKKKKEGKLTQFANEKNKLFRIVGETTTIFARKF